VRFPSIDADLGGDAPTTLTGYLERPSGPGPFSAVVLLHGCNGLFEDDERMSDLYLTWAQHLCDRGFLTLLVDSYRPRGLGFLCSTPERDRPIQTDRERVRDAYGALLYLQGRSDVRSTGIGVMGWSNGAQAALWTIAESNPVRAASPRDFHAAVGLYPSGCTRAAQARWRSSVPLLLLVGEADDWTGARPCLELAAGARAVGATVETVVYPEAPHAFDAPNWPVRVLTAVVFGDGRSPTVGTNPKARADALERVPAYFRRHLGP
jgi:dienelactone hydrolase